MRGKFIVFEGLDRAGKSTQCSRLVKNLEDEGCKVKHMSFPDRSTPIGRMIDEYLKGDSQQEDHVIHLLFSANRWEAAASIKAAIEAGIIVVVDRYYYSGCVYSAAKKNPLLSLRWARQPEVGLPRPDICIFLDISPEAAAQRGGFGQEKYEKKEFQNRVRELFAELQAAQHEMEDFVNIYAGESTDLIEAQISICVQKAIDRVDAGDLPLKLVEPW
ncbi:hypothetical protein LTR04_000769 [Oleoguttula sp. CCFEE 6159]|nr:hypothetical protein LTR04_000769 [Oleoguttula sp. CCFEE 6159]